MVDPRTLRLTSAAGVALLLGVLVYLGDRHGNAYFLPTALYSALPWPPLFGDLGPRPWVEDSEAPILQLVLDLLDAQPVGQWRIDVERLASDTLLLLRLQRVDRPDVVETVAQLDDQHAQILRHRNHHLANRRRLRLFPGSVVQAVELRDTIDQVGDLGAELRRDLLERHVGVLDRVVKERGCERGAVHPVVRQDLGHGDRVSDEGCAALARLTVVSRIGQPVGPLQDLYVALGVTVSERLDDERDRAASNAAALDHLDLRIKATEDLRSVPRDVVDLARSIEEADSRFERLEQQQVSARAALAFSRLCPS